MKARTDFERQTLPTLLELRVGNPAEVRGLTAEAISLKAFCETAKATIKAIGEVHFRVHDDPTLNDASKLVRSAGHARQKIKDARQTFGERMDAALPRFGRLSGAVRSHLAPPANAGEAGVDAELRTWLRTQDAGA
ncbi:MAG: hypothetical protein IT495_21890, partial [Gammaproteobacteria bacterium]|nr:hypothetical protein [Gammaproteobacteria bacterium]